MTQPRVTFHCLLDSRSMPTAVETWRRAFEKRASGSTSLNDGDAGFSIVLADRDSCPVGLEGSQRRVVWVADRDGYDRVWVERVRAWRPWRVLVSRLADEGLAEIPADLRQILVWLPPVVCDLPPCETLHSGETVAWVIDRGEPRETRMALSRQEQSPEGVLNLDRLIEMVREPISITAVDARAALHDAESRMKIARCLIVASAVREPSAAHAVRRMASALGRPFVNLLCESASPLRGLGPPLIGRTGLTGIRELLAPLTTAHQRTPAARPDAVPTDLESWIDFIDAESGSGVAADPRWVAVHRLLRAEFALVDVGMPGLRLALGLRLARAESQLSDAVDCLGADDHPEGWVCDFLRQERSPAWLERFTTLWRRVPGWLDLCARAGELAVNRRGWRDLRGMAAWGVARGVCGGFACEWRHAMMETAVGWWADERRDGRMSPFMLQEEVVARATLRRVDEVDVMLSGMGPRVAGLGARAATALVRELMPAVENGVLDDGGLRALTVARRWIGADGRTMGADPSVVAASVTLETYAGQLDRAIELLGEKGGDALLPTAALYFWLCGNESLFGRCVAEISRDAPDIPASRRLPLATVHALAGDAEAAVAHLRAAHLAMPAMMTKSGPINLRWLCLALTLTALGGGRKAEQWRARAKQWHPQGEARDRHFSRVRVCASGLELPEFVVEAEHA